MPLQTHCGGCRGIAPHSQQQLYCHCIKFTLSCYWLDSLQMRQACKPLDFSPCDPEIGSQKSLCKKKRPICPTAKSKGLISTCKFTASSDPDSNPKQSMSVNFQFRRNPLCGFSLMDDCTAASKPLSQKAILGIGLGLCVLPSLPCMGTAKALRKAGLWCCSIMHVIS